jgi:hypothetical protein
MTVKWIRMTRGEGPGIHLFRGVKIEKKPEDLHGEEENVLICISIV